MASQTEIALVNANGRAKTSKARAGRPGGASEKTNDTSGRKTGAAAKRQPSGTDIVPVMKLRAIDIVDDESPLFCSDKAADSAETEERPVIHMPPPEQADDGDALENRSNGEEKKSHGETGKNDAADSLVGDSQVSDPELLELLEQLSATIDTANTVLDAASTVSPDESQLLAELANNGSAGIGPKPSHGPQTEPESEDEDLPPIAAQLANHGKNDTDGRKKGIGFGLVANTALTGLVFAAGAAWVLHTNPWLVEYAKNGRAGAGAAVSAPSSPAPAIKDQSSLAMKAPSPQAQPAPAAKPQEAALASFAPPDEDPVPMEIVAPANQPAAEAPSGAAGQLIDLNITLPGNAGSPDISVMVQGVPEQAALSDGKDLGSGNWLLNADQLRGLKLVTQNTLKPDAYTLEVILVQSDGSVPETRKVEVTVEPKLASASGTQAETPVASAPAGTEFVKGGVAIDVQGEASPAPAVAAETASKPKPVAGPQLTPQELGALLSRGETLLQEGDIAGARLLLEYAALRGSKDAMVTLAKSYDPEHLSNLGVHGVQANPEKATRWYARAAETTQ